MNVRVRFAPSPTGDLHIGGVRTALFNWFFARHCGGRFVLRIEDTDRTRSTLKSVEAILEGLRWLGIDWDEGPLSAGALEHGKGEFGPYFQSRRQERYQRRVEELKSRGSAYEQEGAVRFRMPREPVTFSDMIVGEVTRPLTDREARDPDFVLVRSDGQPVFHLVNVVDDLEMRITHVIRGEDHLSNTPKHVALFRALDANPPHYAHLPLILNADGSKMSKRDEGASLRAYQAAGFAPEAVVNYLCLLGWSPEGNREIMPVQEVIKAFELSQVHRHNARFDWEKLNWMNGVYLAAMKPERYQALARSVLADAGIALDRFPQGYTAAALETTQGKLKTLSEIRDYAGFYFESADQVDMDPEAAERFLVPENRAGLEWLRRGLAAMSGWGADAIQDRFKATAQARNVKPRVLVHPVRVACTGKTRGPSLYHLMEVLGRQRVLECLDRAIRRINAQES